MGGQRETETWRITHDAEDMLRCRHVATLLKTRFAETRNVINELNDLNGLNDIDVHNDPNISW